MDESSNLQESEVQCRLVNQNHVLWTCHKACKIEFGDCVFAICSVCYTEQNREIEKNKNCFNTNIRKRRRGPINRDDDITSCNHNFDFLVPFMDQTFFTEKYKETIRNENYMLPVICSVCKMELVDKVKSDHTYNAQKVFDV